MVYISEIGKMEKIKIKELITGQMVQNLKAILLMTKFMAKVFYI